MSLNEQESTSQVKKQISDEFIQENNYHTNIMKQRYLKTKQSRQIKTPDVDTETKSNHETRETRD